MYPYILAPEAELDLASIIDYIAAADTFAASRYLGFFLDSFEALAKHPDMGYKRPKWAKNRYRYWTVRNRYTIVYKPASKPLTVIRILRTTRNIPKLL